MSKEKKNPFTEVSKDLPFYPDKTQEAQEEFYCTVVGETELGDKEEKKMPVYILANVQTGEEVFCLKSYSVEKVIKRAKEVLGSLDNAVIKLHFKGKTMVNNKPFNKFDTGFCSLEDYEAFVKGDEKPTKKK